MPQDEIYCFLRRLGHAHRLFSRSHTPYPGPVWNGPVLRGHFSTGCFSDMNSSVVSNAHSQKSTDIHYYGTRSPKSCSISLCFVSERWPRISGAITGNIKSTNDVLVRPRFELYLFGHPKKLPPGQLNVAALTKLEEREAPLTEIATKLDIIISTPTDEVFMGNQ